MTEVISGMVSTVIPVHNRPRLIVEAVNSVLAQTYRPIEVVIVNDGSTDETGLVVEELAKQQPGVVNCLHIPNSGPGAAREAGRLTARGEYIQYLDSDDILMPSKFERQVAGLVADVQCNVAYGKTRHYHIDQGPRDIAWKRTGERIGTMFPSFLQSRWWGTSTPLYRRRVVERAGSWLNLWNEEDWEYDCRLAAQGVKLHFCDEFVSDQRYTHRPSVSSGGSSEPAKLADRATAHNLIYQHAVRYGVAKSAPEMRHFARELFLLSRQCGAAGLGSVSKRLFCLAREATEPEHKDRMDFTLYRLVAEIVGWSRAGSLACRFDKLRPVRRDVA